MLTLYRFVPYYFHETWDIAWHRGGRLADGYQGGGSLANPKT